MYMGRVGFGVEGEILAELKGARILITGLSSTCGVDVARAFADLRARLIIHTAELSPEMTALIAVLSQGASDIKVYTDPIDSNEDAIRFAQTAAEAFGGLDAVINFAVADFHRLPDTPSENDLETVVNAVLSPLAHLTRVTANRMRVVFSDGVILNVLRSPGGTGRQRAFAAFARTALTAMTDYESRAWAGHGIRVNAIGPTDEGGGDRRNGAQLANEPDIAALAVYLASRRGRTLSGYVFDCVDTAAL